jgi:hypothetical protein
MTTGHVEMLALLGYPLGSSTFAIYTDEMFMNRPGEYAVIDSDKLAAWLIKRKCLDCAHQVKLMRAFNCNHIRFIPGDLLDLGLTESPKG